MTTQRTNHIGTISLLAAVGGFVAMETARHLQLIGSVHAWQILQTGFEAGMVGGFADWFAVSAIFRPIPSRRIKLPHTNLLVANRQTLSSGIVDMVQNRWLSPAALSERLSDFSACRYIFGHLDSSASRANLSKGLRELLERCAGSLNTQEIVGFLDRALRDQLAGLELGPIIGRWMEARIKAGDTNALWDFMAESLAHSAETGNFKTPIRKMLKQAASNYKDRGLWEKIKLGTGEFFIDYGELSENISEAITGILRDIQSDQEHPLRQKLDELFLNFTHKLAKGDREACSKLDHFQKRLVENAEIGPMLSRILSRLQDTFTQQLHDSNSNLTILLDRSVESILQTLQSEPETQVRIDAWVRSSILELAERHHDEIGNIVAGSLAKLSDEDLVRQIEEKIGSDLQYIRLNGAVVGSLVGMTLACLKLLMGGKV